MQQFFDQVSLYHLGSVDGHSQPFRLVLHLGGVRPARSVRQGVRKLLYEPSSTSA
jgi:hypothetical protein